jgi:FixJ family two-component response regulator
VLWLLAIDDSVFQEVKLTMPMAEVNIEIPIVFITGLGDIPTSVHAMKAGAVEFLTKPWPAASFRNERRGQVMRRRTSVYSGIG